MSVRTCAVCRKSAEWDESWEWYGSIRAAEDCGCTIPTCSPVCRKTAKAERLIAQYDREHYSGKHRRVPLKEGLRQ